MVVPPSYACMASWLQYAYLYVVSVCGGPGHPIHIDRLNLTELAVEAIDGWVSMTWVLGDSCKGGAQCMHVVVGAFTNNLADGAGEAVENASCEYGPGLYMYE